MSDKNNSGFPLPHPALPAWSEVGEGFVRCDYYSANQMLAYRGEPLVRLSDAEAALAAKQEKFSKLLADEHALSDSYVRIREMVGAMDPPSVTDAFALYAYVEAKVLAFAGLNAELVEALKLGYAQIALLGGTPDPEDPDADAIQVAVQKVIRDALAKVRP